MDSPVLALHAGTQKTATTSLQVFWSDNDQWLAARGVHYARSGRVYYGHHNLPWELSRDPRFDAGAGTLEDLQRELQGLSAPTVLVSSEDLEVLYSDQESLRRLRDLADSSGRTAIVIVTLREPADYLESLYAELLNKGTTRTLAQVAAEALRGGGVLAERMAVREPRSGGTVYTRADFRIDYDQLVSGFARVFGDEFVRVVPYEPGSDMVAAFHEAFPSIFGPPDQNGLPELQRHNPRHDDGTLAELLVRNRRTAGRRLVDGLRRKSPAVFRLPEDTRTRFERFELTRQRLLATHGSPKGPAPG